MNYISKSDLQPLRPDLNVRVPQTTRWKLVASHIMAEENNKVHFTILIP